MPSDHAPAPDGHEQYVIVIIGQRNNELLKKKTLQARLPSSTKQNNGKPIITKVIG
jgi:hypothetical protein